MVKQSPELIQALEARRLKGYGVGGGVAIDSKGTMLLDPKNKTTKVDSKKLTDILSEKMAPDKSITIEFKSAFSDNDIIREGLLPITKFLQREQFTGIGKESVGKNENKKTYVKTFENGMQKVVEVTLDKINKIYTITSKDLININEKNNKTQKIISDTSAKLSDSSKKLAKSSNTKDKESTSTKGEFTLIDETGYKMRFSKKDDLYKKYSKSFTDDELKDGTKKTGLNYDIKNSRFIKTTATGKNTLKQEVDTNPIGKEIGKIIKNGKYDNVDLKSTKKASESFTRDADGYLIPIKGGDYDKIMTYLNAANYERGTDGNYYKGKEKLELSFELNKDNAFKIIESKMDKEYKKAESTNNTDNNIVNKTENSVVKLPDKVSNLKLGKLGKYSLGNLDLSSDYDLSSKGNQAKRWDRISNLDDSFGKYGQEYASELSNTADKTSMLNLFNSVTSTGLQGYKDRWNNAGLYQEYEKDDSGDIKKDGNGKKILSGKKGLDKKERNKERLAMTMDTVNSVNTIATMFSAMADNSKLELTLERNRVELLQAAALTEEDRLEAEKQSLELKLQEIDAQLNSTNQYAGAGVSNGAGYAINGAMSGAAAGAAFGPIGAGIGAISGGLMGISSYGSAKRDAEIQKSQARSLYAIEKHTKATKDAVTLSNTIYTKASGNVTKIGVEEAYNSAMTSMYNDQSTMANTLVGTGTGNYTRTESGGASHSDKTIPETVSEQVTLYNAISASEGISSQAAKEKAGDVSSKEDLQKYYAEIAAYKAKSIDTLSTSGNNSTAASNSATIQAYSALLAKLQDMINLSDKLEKQASVAYFGAELTEKMDAMGQIIDYEADWTSMLTTVMSTSREITKDMTANSTFASTLIDGLANIYIQNLSGVEDAFTEKMQALYNSIAVKAISGVNYSSELHQMVIAIDEYEQAQLATNEAVYQFGQAYVSAGGDITDILDSIDSLTSGLVRSLMTSGTSGNASSGISAMLSTITDTIKAENVEAVLDAVGTKLYTLSSNLTSLSTQADIEAYAAQLGSFSDYMSDVEMYQDTLRNVYGVPQSTIDSLIQTQALEKAINEEIKKRLSDSSLVDTRTSDAQSALENLLINFRNQGDLDSLLLERYNEAIAKLEQDKVTVRDSVRDFTEQWLSGAIEGTFDVVQDQIDSASSEMIQSFQSALSADNYGAAFDEIGSSIASSVIDAYVNEVVNAKYKTQLAAVNSQMYEMLNLAEDGTVNLTTGSALAQEVRKLTVQMESDMAKINTLQDLLSSNELRMNTSENLINYESSSTKENVYNINNNSYFEIGNLISTDSSLRQFSEQITPFLIKAFKNAGVIV